MKVVHLSTTDYGGAYKAAERISKSMKSVGVDSKVLVRTKTRADTIGIEIINSPTKKLISKTKNVCNLMLSESEVISDYFGTDVINNPYVCEADVIFLHWVNSFVAYKGVEKMLRAGKRIVWVMHDMWLFTGGCHIDQFCGGYESGCKDCPRIKKKRISKNNYMRKAEMLSEGNIILVGPSNWLVECAKKSKITRQKNIFKIPNPVDRTIFYPMNCREKLRKKFHIPSNKKVILFGAMKSNEDKNKGFQVLVNALKEMSDERYVVVIFGNSTKVGIQKLSMEIISIGMIEDENRLSELYNCADVFVAPSLQESFGYTVSEALSCGVPVVAYDTTGIKDQIQHKKNGYLVPVNENKGIKKGIEWCVDNKEKIEDYLLLNNSYLAIGKKYLELCEMITSDEDTFK